MKRVKLLKLSQVYRILKYKMSSLEYSHELLEIKYNNDYNYNSFSFSTCNNYIMSLVYKYKKDNAKEYMLIKYCINSQNSNFGKEDITYLGNTNFSFAIISPNCKYIATCLFTKNGDLPLFLSKLSKIKLYEIKTHVLSLCSNEYDENTSNTINIKDMDQTNIIFSPCSNYLSLVCDKDVILYYMNNFTYFSNETLKISIESGEIDYIKFSKDENYLAVVSNEKSNKVKTITIYGLDYNKVASLKQLTKFTCPINMLVCDITFFPFYELIAVALKEGNFYCDCKIEFLEFSNNQIEDKITREKTKKIKKKRKVKDDLGLLKHSPYKLKFELGKKDIKFGNMSINFSHCGNYIIIGINTTTLIYEFNLNNTNLIGNMLHEYENFSLVNSSSKINLLLVDYNTCKKKKYIKLYY